jgi:hypothetical protein
LYESLKISNKDDVHIYITATTSAFLKNNKGILEDLFYKSLLAKAGKYPLFDLQSELLGAIITGDKARKKYVNLEAQRAKSLKKLIETKSSINKIKHSQRLLDSMKNYSESARLFVAQLRSIGDGVAWRFLNYDRAALRILAEHQYIPPPEMGRGLLAEIEKFARFASKGQPVIMNSITNFLRVGDLTVYDESSGKYDLIEVKAGNSRTLRTIRQSYHRDVVQKALDNGYHTIFPDIPITIIMSRYPLLTYVKSLERAMSEAEHSFGSSRKFGEHFSMAVFSLQKLRKLPENESTRISEQIMDRLFSIRRKPNDILIGPINNIFLTVHFSRIIAPYTIFPIHPKYRIALLSGDYLIFFLFNLSGFVRWLKKRGWEATEIVPSADPPTSHKWNNMPRMRFWKHNNPKLAEVGADLFHLAVAELWMPQSIEQDLITILEQLPSQSGYSINHPNKGKCAWH